MAQMQAIQQTQVNNMLNQLPQQQRSLIESAVNEYRTGLTNQGHTPEMVQTYVWTYYTQCVQKLFQSHNQKDGGAQQGALQGQLPDPSLQHDQQPQQEDQSEQSKNLLQHQQQQQQQMMQQQMLLRQQAGLLGQQMGGLGATSMSMMTASTSTNSPAGQCSLGGFAQGCGGQGMGAAYNLAVLKAQQAQQEQDQSQQQEAAAAGAGTSGSDGVHACGWGCGKADQGYLQGSLGQQQQMLQGGGSWGGGFMPGSLSQQQQMLQGGGGAFGGCSQLSGPAQTSAKSASMGYHRPKGGCAGMSGVAGGMGPGPSQQFPTSGIAPSSAPGCAGMSANPTATGQVSFQLNVPRPPGPAGMAGLRGPSPAARSHMQQMQMQKASHWLTAGMTRPGAVPAGSSTLARPLSAMGMPGGQTSPGGVRGPYGGVRGPGMGNPVAASGAQRGPGPQFPPAMRNWLQRLFQTVQSPDADPDLGQQTHKYCRHWVQVWVKTGEFLKRDWDTVPLPTPDEIRAGLPPGALAGKAGNIGMPCGGKGGWGQVRPMPWMGVTPGSENSAGQAPHRPRVVYPPNRGIPDSTKDKRSRSRGNSRKRRSRRSPSTSRSRSRSNNRHGDSSGPRDASKSRDRPQEPAQPPWGCWRNQKGQGKGELLQQPSHWRGKGQENEPLGLDGKRLTPDEMKDKIAAYLDEKLTTFDWRGNPRGLQDELQRVLNIGHKRFRNIFQQSLGQYVHTWYMTPRGPGGKPYLQAGPKAVSQDEQEMRAQRAARFQSHLQVERATVAMVSFGEEGANVDGGPIIGELNDMCSREEAREREQTRQLDKLEWKQGTDPKHPEVNMAFATKKYQRSSADKAYRSQDVRTLDACDKTMKFLMSDILDFDWKPKERFAVQKIPYIEVYSYLRDRTRSVRVDLHLQQPRSTTHRTFVETHECCLRFEMLSLFILSGGSGGSTEKYDQKLGLKAISQTIEPLLNAYQAVRDKQLARSILEAMGDLLGDADEEEEREFGSPYEPAIHRYIVLLLMAFSPEELQSHLAKLNKEILIHPLVSFATKAYAAFQTDDYSRFLRCYRQTDFLTAVAMSGVADLARLRSLWLLMRSYPQPVGDKLSLARIKNVLAFASDAHARSFLAFHGVSVVDGASGPTVVLPKKGSPEAERNKLLAPGRLPDKCEYPKGADSMLERKLEELGLSRKDIVFGGADPQWTEEETPDPTGNAEVVEVEADAKQVTCKGMPGGELITAAGEDPLTPLS